MSKRNNITQAHLKERLVYEEESGNFYWKSTNSTKIKLGERSGTVDKSIGYEKIQIDGIIYYSHRLAWLYIYGYLPSLQIDHIDGNGLNNRINNLREASIQQQRQNQKIYKNNTSGISGVSWNKRLSKWFVYINTDCKRNRIGCFSSLEEAIEARKKAKAYIHTFNPIQRCSNA